VTLKPDPGPHPGVAQRSIIGILHRAGAIADGSAAPKFHLDTKTGLPNRVHSPFGAGAESTFIAFVAEPHLPDRPDRGRTR